MRKMVSDNHWMTGKLHEIEADITVWVVMLRSKILRQRFVGGRMWVTTAGCKSYCLIEQLSCVGGK